MNTGMTATSQTAMSFKINVKGLLAGITPAVVVATTNVLKDSKTANHLVLQSTPECLFAISNGGSVSIRNPIPFMSTFCTDYKFEVAGSAVVNATDLVAVLSSFKSDEVLLVSMVDGEAGVGSEVSFRPISDPEQLQTLPVYSLKLESHSVSKKIENEITINRELLTRAMSRIMFAGGYEEMRPRYHFWVIRSWPGRIRFVAGSGSRFAIYEASGPSLSKLPESSLLIPVKPGNVVLKAFKDATSDTVTIKQSVADDKQYLFQCGDLQLMASGFHPTTAFIDENDLLERANTSRFTIDMKELAFAVKGIEATHNAEADDLLKKSQKIHSSSFEFDFQKKVGSIRSAFLMKSIRKFKLADIESKVDINGIACATELISELVRHADGSDSVQFELVDKDKPLVVRFYANPMVSSQALTRSNPALGIDEQFSMFFAQLNKPGRV
jgi:DNA polymerase III sliding clamp (beta) subunit (PCNA family)